MTSFTQRLALLLAGSALCGAALMAGVQAKAQKPVAAKSQTAATPKVQATKTATITPAKSAKKTSAKTAAKTVAKTTAVKHRRHRHGKAPKSVTAPKASQGSAKVAKA